MHSLIVGMTGSGKTTLAKRICAQKSADGDLCIVLTPFNDREWSADEIIEHKTEADARRFLALVWKTKNAHVFIDEAGDLEGKVEKDFRMIASRGRHWGHRGYFISQRSRDIHIRIRNNCDTVFAFAQYPYDAQLLAEDFNDDGLMAVVEYPPGLCVVKRRFTPAKRLELFKSIM